jgi:hypothetical protein
MAPSFADFPYHTLRAYLIQAFFLFAVFDKTGEYGKVKAYDAAFGD